MIVERLTASALFFHDPGTRLGIGHGPVEDAVLEQLVEKIVEPIGETVPTPAGSETSDAVEDLPNGDGREADALGGDGIEKGGNAGFRSRPHHFGDDVRVN